MSACKIKVQSIATRFGSVHVHRDVSFEIGEPSVVAIIGGSGAGKSVLLREIIGLQRPSSGKVWLLGEEIWNANEAALRAVRSRIGVLFQNGALFSALTVAQNIAAPILECMEIEPKLLDKLVELRLALSGLPASTASKMPSELSGGMRKRVALARALALEPEILFLDEPTSGLDPINARAFDALVRTLCDSLGLTIVMITHDLDTLWGIADRVIVLADGRVIADGPTAQIAEVDHEWIRDYFAATHGARQHA